MSRINDVSVSKNFKLYEFECKDGNHQVVVSPMLITKLQQLRDRIGKPIIITSAYRNATHNKKVGGASNSQHLYGKAVDIKVNGMSPSQVAKEAEKIGFTGIGIYKTFTHVDVRDIPARWVG